MFAVIRNCCFGPCCSSSQTIGGDRHRPYEYVKLVQYATQNREMADKVAKNFAAYSAEVEEVTEETYAKLCEKAANWLRTQMKQVA